MNNQHIINRIADMPAFPVFEDCCNDGMTYRYWLIGVALSNFASAETRYVHTNAMAAIAHADEVIKLLAKELE